MIHIDPIYTGYTETIAPSNQSVGRSNRPGGAYMWGVSNRYPHICR